MFAMQSLPARAQHPTASLSITFGSQSFATTTIGQSFPLNINIFVGANPIRGTSLQCFQDGTSLSASSISRLPDTVLIGANQSFSTQQYYRAVSAGTTNVYCIFKGVDTVTGFPVTITSAPASITVSGETRLYLSTSSAQKRATVGQAIFVTLVYGNRGKNTLTNVRVDCLYSGGRGIGLISSRQTQTTLPSGQSGFAEYRLQGFIQGASGLFLCSVTATDSVTGEVILLNALPISINIV
jgi:hypothetical protein